MSDGHISFIFYITDLRLDLKGHHKAQANFQKIFALQLSYPVCYLKLFIDVKSQFLKKIPTKQDQSLTW